MGLPPCCLLGTQGSTDKNIGPIYRQEEAMNIQKMLVALSVLVMVATVAPSARAETAAAPLYDRLGGLKGITVVVDDFINRLVANKQLNKNPAINAGRKRSPAPYLKFQVSQLICELSGGPCKYTGKSMKESHAHLNISENEWGVMAGEFQKSLNKYKVPAGEQKDLFDMVGKTKADIVVRK
ncbi:MAG: group I truncated hemoglobin [Gammaproteobacteria bacterium]